MANTKQYVDKFTLPSGEINYVRDAEAQSAISDLTNNKQNKLVAGNNITINDSDGGEPSTISASVEALPYNYIKEDQSQNIYLNTSNNEIETSLISSGTHNVIQGQQNIIYTGNNNHIEGYQNIIQGNNNQPVQSAHVEGEGTIAVQSAQHVGGKFNVAGNYLEIIGNGNSSAARSNARVLDWNGNATYSGRVTAGSPASNSFDLVTLQQLNNYIDGITDTNTTYSLDVGRTDYNNSIYLKGNNNTTSTVVLNTASTETAGLMSATQVNAFNNHTSAILTLNTAMSNKQNQLYAGDNITITDPQGGASGPSTISVNSNISLQHYADTQNGSVLGKISGSTCNVASGNYSVAEGLGTTAVQQGSHAEGLKTLSGGSYAHAEGGQTTAGGQYSHTEGYKTWTKAARAHAGGSQSTAQSANSFVHGLGLLSSTFSSGTGFPQVVFGKYNLNDSTKAFIIGNGSSPAVLKNIFTVSHSGKVTAAADGTSGYDLITYRQLSQLASSVESLIEELTALKQELGLT